MPLIQRDAPYPHWEFSDAGSGDRLRLVPDRGGLVTGWRCQGEELLYLDQQRFADPALSVRGGIPVLFPICGDLPAGTLPLPQHGFARDEVWSLTELADGRGVQMSLNDNSRTRAVYPFQFQLDLAVRLESAALQLSVTVHNSGSTTMPFSLGLHPYFAVSGLEGVRVEGLPETGIDQSTQTEVNPAQQIDLLAEGIDLLAIPADGRADGSRVSLLDGPAHRRLELQCEPPLDLVVIWSDPPRPMVCLEPWTSPRRSLVTGERRLELAPGASLELGCRYVMSTVY